MGMFIVAPDEGCGDIGIDIGAPDGACDADGIGMDIAPAGAAFRRIGIAMAPAPAWCVCAGAIFLATAFPPAAFFVAAFFGTCFLGVDLLAVGFFAGMSMVMPGMFICAKAGAGNAASAAAKTVERRRAELGIDFTGPCARER